MDFTTEVVAFKDAKGVQAPRERLTPKRSTVVRASATLNPEGIQAPIAVPQAIAPKIKPRQDWVDNLRPLTILLVVKMHACVTYSWVGSWYYNALPEPVPAYWARFLGALR